MPEEASPGGEQVRAAEVIAALSLATDLGIGVPLEHGLQSTLFAMRLGERLGVDSATASQTYYACLLFYVGCTAGAEVAGRATEVPLRAEAREPPIIGLSSRTGDVRLMDPTSTAWRPWK